MYSVLYQEYKWTQLWTPHRCAWSKNIGKENHSWLCVESSYSLHKPFNYKARKYSKTENIHEKLISWQSHRKSWYITMLIFQRKTLHNINIVALVRPYPLALPNAREGRRMKTNVTDSHTATLKNPKIQNHYVLVLRSSDLSTFIIPSAVSGGVWILRAERGRLHSRS